MSCAPAGDHITRLSCLHLFPGIEFLLGLLASSLYLNGISQSPDIQLAWALSALPCMNTEPVTHSGTCRQLIKAPVTILYPPHIPLINHQLVCQSIAGPNPNWKFRSLFDIRLSIIKMLMGTRGFTSTSSEKLPFSWLFSTLANYCAKPGGRAPLVWHATAPNFFYPQYTWTDGMLLNLLSLKIAVLTTLSNFIVFYIFKILFYSLSYCAFLEGSAWISLFLFGTFKPLKLLLHPFIFRHSPEPSSTFCTLLWEILHFPSHFQSYPSRRRAPILELFRGNLPLPHVSARLSYGHQHKDIPCSSMKNVCPKNTTSIVFKSCSQECIQLPWSQISYNLGASTKQGLWPYMAWFLLFCFIFVCLPTSSTSSHIVPIYGLCLPIFGSSILKRNIIKWVNSSTLYGSVVHSPSTLMHFKQFLRKIVLLCTWLLIIF